MNSPSQNIPQPAAASQHLPVTIVILTLNEEANIRECIASCEASDDVHVLDSGSTDRTQEIARELGASVHEHPFTSFGDQRNWAIENIPHKYDWVFHLDADERMTPGLIREMKNILSRNQPYAGFYVPHKLFFMGRWIQHAEGYPVYQMRLFHKERMRFRDYGHGQREQTTGMVGRLYEPYLHFNFSKGVDDWLDKHNRYSTLEARNFHQRGHIEPNQQLSPFGGTVERRRYFKAHIYPKMPGKYLWRFLWMYIIKGGFLDGIPGFHYCLLISTYELFTSLKLREFEMQKKTSPLPPHKEELPRISQKKTPAALPNGVPAATYVERFGQMIAPGTRVIVTGGSGFIGSNLVTYLKQTGVDVLSLDHSPPRNPANADVWKKVDLLDAGNVSRVVRDFGPELMFHLAARTDLNERSNIAGYASNTTGVENLLQAMEGLTSLRRIVITSSQLVSEPGYAMRHTHDYRPHTMYGESKVATERITFAWKNAPCPWVMARPTSIWGPWFDEPYRGFFLTIDRGRYFHQRGVDPRRSFGFVGNCIYQYIKLALAPADQVDGKVFYISDYEAVRVRDWANIIQREMGVSRVREIPVEALAASARIGDLAKNLGWKNPPITSFRLKNLTSDNIVDANATSNVVGELPYSIEEGVRMTVDWLKKQGLLSPESRGKSVLRARAAQSHAVE